MLFEILYALMRSRTGKVQFGSNDEYKIEFYCDELD